MSQQQQSTNHMDVTAPSVEFESPSTQQRHQHLALLLSVAYPGALHPLHRADLEKSALTDDTIQRQKIRSVPPGMIQQLLGFNPDGVTSAMLIPFADPAGGWMPHVRVKIFPPKVKRSDDGGEQTIKYLQPRNSGMRLFFPVATIDAARTSREPLHLVEGEKKALAMAQLGFPAIGFCGVEGWHLKGNDALLDDFDTVALQDRMVLVYPDSDVASNKMVRHAVMRLGVALDRRGAQPELVQLPPAGAAA
jgi:uncharacterized protein DUF3854